MKLSKPKGFTGVKKAAPRNSGMFSGGNGGSQKRDPQIKASTGKQAPVSTLKSAVNVPKKKSIS